MTEDYEIVASEGDIDELNELPDTVTYVNPDGEMRKVFHEDDSYVVSEIGGKNGPRIAPDEDVEDPYSTLKELDERYDELRNPENSNIDGLLSEEVEDLGITEGEPEDSGSEGLFDEENSVDGLDI